MNAFSDMMMRTHPGLDPSLMVQVYDSPDIASFFARFVKIHVALKTYKRQLMQEAYDTGVPPVRPMLMEFEDPNVEAIDDQFMLGSDLLMAPIFVEGATSRDVYLPKGKWVHYFTREIEVMVQGGWVRK